MTIIACLFLNAISIVFRHRNDLNEFWWKKQYFLHGLRVSGSYLDSVFLFWLFTILPVFVLFSRIRWTWSSKFLTPFVQPKVRHWKKSEINFDALIYKQTINFQFWHNYTPIFPTETEANRCRLFQITQIKFFRESVQYKFFCGEIFFAEKSCKLFVWFKCLQYGFFSHSVHCAYHKLTPFGTSKNWTSCMSSPNVTFAILVKVIPKGRWPFSRPKGKAEIWKYRSTSHVYFWQLQNGTQTKELENIYKNFNFSW